MATFLVTGGAGYFGECLVRRLAPSDAVIRLFDLNPLDGEFGSRVEIAQGDIRDADAILRATQGVDYVLHNLAQVPLAKDRHLIQSVNVLGTKNMLEAALAARVKKLIYISTSAVFGIPKSNPLTEASPPSPAELYGHAKLAAENLCIEYAAKGLDATIIRPRTIIGHGRLGIFQILFEWVFQGANVPVFNGGRNIFQFVHADDLADAILAACHRPGPTVYNCGAENYGTMREVLEALCRHAGTGSQIRTLPLKPLRAAMHLADALHLSPLAAYHALLYGESFYYDTSKLTRELGWHARYSNDAMMVESYDWYVANREHIMQQQRKSIHRSPVPPGILKLVSRML